MPWRYRWPDEVRDDVLARLLERNAKRAEEERLAGKTAAIADEKKCNGSKRGRKKNEPDGPKLIDMSRESKDG